MFFNNTVSYTRIIDYWCIGNGTQSLGNILMVSPEKRIINAYKNWNKVNIDTLHGNFYLVLW